MDETRRIVLLGKTGSGKSRLGNTIVGEDVFEVNHSSVSGTKTCKAVTRQVNGRKIKLIDSPGIFDTDPESSESSPELLKCIEECAPGPHAFLLLLRVAPFTRQEQAIVDVILKYFSEEALKYTTVVFTHGDDLPDDTKVEDWVTENPALKNLIQKCGGRCHVFDNRHWNNSQDGYRNNQVQIQNLLNTIEATVRENGGKCYSNEMLQKVASDKRILINLAGVSTGVLLGALLGVPVMILFTLPYLNSPVPNLLIAVSAVGGALGGAVGGYKGYKAAKKAKTPRAAAKAVVLEAKDFLLGINKILQQNKIPKLK